MSVATILNPRFKKIHFRDLLADIIALNEINIRLKSLNAVSTEKNSPKALSKEIIRSCSVWEIHDAL